MDENEALGCHSSNATERRSELRSDPPEAPPQRWRAGEAPCLPRNEQIRLVVLGSSLLALLAGFLLFLFGGTTFPLFGTMVVVFLGYRQIDARLDTSERSRD